VADVLDATASAVTAALDGELAVADSTLRAVVGSTA